MTPATAASLTPSPTYKWWFFAMPWLISFFNYSDRQAIFSLFPLLLGGVFGTIGARVATHTERAVVAVVMSQAEFEALWHARLANGGSLKADSKEWQRV